MDTTILVMLPLLGGGALGALGTMLYMQNRRHELTARIGLLEAQCKSQAEQAEALMKAKEEAFQQALQAKEEAHLKALQAKDEANQQALLAKARVGGAL